MNIKLMVTAHNLWSLRRRNQTGPPLDWLTCCWCHFFFLSSPNIQLSWFYYSIQMRKYCVFVRSTTINMKWRFLFSRNQNTQTHTHQDMRLDIFLCQTIAPVNDKNNGYYELFVSCLCHMYTLIHAAFHTRVDCCRAAAHTIHFM